MFLLTGGHKGVVYGSIRVRVRDRSFDANIGFQGSNPAGLFL